jgi:hypothetical protein
MTSPFSRDMLAGALLARGLHTDGDADALHARLGDALVKDLLTPKRGTKRKASTTWRSNHRSQSEWVAFMKRERPNVLNSGFTARAEVIREIARRWRIFKTVGTSDAPLALPAPSSDDSESDSTATPDGLLDALRDLDGAELNASLLAHGIPLQGDHEDKIKALAAVMLA